MPDHWRPPITAGQRQVWHFGTPQGQSVWPDVDGGDLDAGFVTQKEFVVAGHHAAMLFEQVDTALDRRPVAAAIGIGQAGEPVL